MSVQSDILQGDLERTQKDLAQVQGRLSNTSQLEEENTRLQNELNMFREEHARALRVAEDSESRYLRMQSQLAGVQKQLKNERTLREALQTRKTTDLAGGYKKSQLSPNQSPKRPPHDLLRNSARADTISQPALMGGERGSILFAEPDIW